MGVSGAEGLWSTLSRSERMGVGVAPGRGMGEALKAVERLWIAADFPSDAATLAPLLDKALAQRD
jgi:hypothetical protein